MKWNILHESRGRMRLHLNKKRMSLAEADQLQDYLTALPGEPGAGGATSLLLPKNCHLSHNKCIDWKG